MHLDVRPLAEAAVSTLDRMADRIGALDLRLVLLALACQLVNVACRSLAWRNVLRAAYPDRPVPLVGVGCAYVAGMAANGLLPARGGDVLKAVFARTRIHGSTLPTVGSSLCVAGIFDSLAAAAALGAVWALGDLPAAPALPAPPLPLVAAALVAAVVAAWLGRAYGGRRLRSLLGHVAQGGAVLRTPGRYLRTVVSLQAVGWLARVGLVFFLLRAFGIEAGLGEALLVLVAGGLAAAVPAAPGGMGAQQVVLVYALAQTASAASVLSFSIGMQVVVTALNGALGLAAAMVLFRTLRPRAALRSGRALLLASRR